ncbi:phage protein NinX family protein [Enterobacter hormaechei]|uniref:phage protein NinX family protein n=1 Tax=Enterobacter hormaechei TaxID=158836 RepID=UPI0006525EAD
MDYSKMSDADLNASVMEVLSDGNQSSRLGTGSAIELLHQVNTVEFGEHIEREEAYATFDPCNNPADAWPIITENKISIYAMSEADKRGGWGAEAFHPNEAYSFNDNPLRAAMIVYLMMQESANVQDNPEG